MARSSASGSSGSRWSVLREPTVPILLAACVVHVVRRNVVDFALFFGTAVLIVATAVRGGSRRGVNSETMRPARPVPAWVLLSGMTIFAAAAALAAPTSLGARLVMISVGLAALAIVLLHPRLPHADAARASRRGGALPGWPVWATIGVAACLWELTSFVAQQVWTLDQNDHPAVSDLVGPLLTTWLGRVVFLLLWVSAGWWLLRRFVADVPPSDSRAAGALSPEGGAVESPPEGTGSGGSAVGERSEPESRHTHSESRPDGHSEAGR